MGPSLQWDAVGVGVPVPMWSPLIVPLRVESPGFPCGPPRMWRGHLTIAWPGWESRLPAQCLRGRGDEAEGFQWCLAGVDRFASRSFCLAHSRHFFGLFSGLQLLQYLVWDTGCSRKTRGLTTVLFSGPEVSS